MKSMLTMQGLVVGMVRITKLCQIFHQCRTKFNKMLTFHETFFLCFITFEKIRTCLRLEMEE